MLSKILLGNLKYHKPGKKKKKLNINLCINEV